MSLASFLSSWLHPVRPDPRILDDLERAVRAVGPSLTSASGLARRLSPALQHANDYCQALVDALPAPLELDPAALAANPLMHAVFPSVADLRTVVGGSTAVRALLADGAAQGADRVVGLLAARRTTRSVLGVALQGETLRHDVAQTLLVFSDQVIAAAAVDEAGARELLRTKAMDSLFETFARHVLAIRDEMGEIEYERGLERAYLELVRQQRRADRVAVHVREIESLNARLRRDVDALQPDRLVDALVEFLSAPEAALRLERCDLRVTRGGAIVEGAAATSVEADALHLDELVSRDRRRHVLVPVRIPRGFADDCLAATRRAIERQIHI